MYFFSCVFFSRDPNPDPVRWSDPMIRSDDLIRDPIRWSVPMIQSVIRSRFCRRREKKRNHFRETAANSAKIHLLARKYAHLRINQIQ